MIRIFSLLMISGLLGASGVAFAQETACAKIDAKGDLNIPCITVNEANHSVVLTHHKPEQGSWNLYFTYDGGIASATAIQKCAKTDNDLNIELSCVEDPSGTIRKVTMSRLLGSELRWDVSSTTKIPREWLFVHTAVEVLAKSTTSWDGSNLPHYPNGKPEISILKITIPPGAELPLHKHPVINAGLLLSGELTVMMEDKTTLHMNAGDTIIELVNKWHFGKNEGNVPAEIIVFYAGIQGEPLSIEK